MLGSVPPIVIGAPATLFATIIAVAPADWAVAASCTKPPTTSWPPPSSAPPPSYGGDQGTSDASGECRALSRSGARGELALELLENRRERATELPEHGAGVEGGPQRTSVGDDHHEVGAVRAGYEGRVLDAGFLHAHVPLREDDAGGLDRPGDRGDDHLGTDRAGRHGFTSLVAVQEQEHRPARRLACETGGQPYAGPHLLPPAGRVEATVEVRSCRRTHRGGDRRSSRARILHVDAQ